MECPLKQVIVSEKVLSLTNRIYFHDNVKWLKLWMSLRWSWQSEERNSKYHLLLLYYDTFNVITDPSHANRQVIQWQTYICIQKCVEWLYKLTFDWKFPNKWFLVSTLLAIAEIIILHEFMYLRCGISITSATYPKVESLIPTLISFAFL